MATMQAELTAWEADRNNQSEKIDEGSGLLMLG